MDSSPDAVPILVIEDRQDQARSIEEMLGADFAVTRAATLADAIEAVENGPRFGCVVFDPLLPAPTLSRRSRRSIRWCRRPRSSCWPTPRRGSSQTR